MYVKRPTSWTFVSSLCAGGLEATLNFRVLLKVRQAFARLGVWTSTNGADFTFTSSLCASVPKLISSDSFWYFDFGTGFDTQKQPKTAAFQY